MTKKTSNKMSPYEMQCIAAANRLKRLSLGRLSDERISYLLQPGFDTLLAPRVEDELSVLWAAAATDGGFHFLGVFDAPSDVLLWTADSWKENRRPVFRMVDEERYEELRSAAVAGGVESMVDAWAAGVPTSDILAG